MMNVNTPLDKNRGQNKSFDLLFTVWFVLKLTARPPRLSSDSLPKSDTQFLEMSREIHQKCMVPTIRWLRVVGCWPRWSHKNKRSEQIYYCYSLVTFLMLFIYLVILAFGLTVHYKSWKTLDEAVEEFIVFATATIVLYKAILFLWAQKDLDKIINYINFNLNERELKDDEDKAVIASCYKHEKSLSNTYVFFGYCITTLYTISSIIKILKQKSLNSQNYTLPLKYPYNPKGFPLYHLTYGHQVIVMTLNGHIGTIADSFFSCLTHYVAGHFKILRNRLSKGSGLVTKDFVLYHDEVIRLVGKVQSVYSRYLVFQLMSSSLCICSGLFQITRISSEGTIHYVKCVIYVIMKMIQLFLYCWYGQDIIEKSASVSHEVYFGTWLGPQEKSVCSNTKMVLRRAQKPVYIKAGSFFIISLPTLASVMNTAYSFFTMLKTVQK